MKHCTMNCGASAKNQKTRAEMMKDCADCVDDDYVVTGLRKAVDTLCAMLETSQKTITSLLDKLPPDRIAESVMTKLNEAEQQDIEDLRHDIERAQTTHSQLLAEIETLKAEREKDRLDAERYHHVLVNGFPNRDFSPVKDEYVYSYNCTKEFPTQGEAIDAAIAQQKGEKS